MKIKMILPALTEAKSPFWRPIKYSLFPPLGLATLAAYCSKQAIKHFAYAGGWKKFEPMWNFMIKTRGLNKMLPLLEAVLSKVNRNGSKGPGEISPFPAIA